VRSRSGRRVDAARRLHLLEHRQALGRVRLVHAGEIVAPDRRDAHERTWLRRERLRRRRLLAGHRALRHGALLDLEEGLAGHAIEDEHQPHLRELHDGRNRAALARDVHEDRLRGRIEIPDVMVDELRVPAARARGRIERDERVGVEVGARSIAAVEVVGGRADRQEHQAAGLVHGHGRPDVRAGAALPRVARPGLVEGLARARDGVEAPCLASGPRVEGAHVARGAARRLLGHEAAGDHEVAVDRRWRGHRVGLALAHVGAGLQVEHATIRERRAWRPRCRIERDEAPIARPREDRRARVTRAVPHGHAAMRPIAHAPAPGEGIEAPRLDTSLRVHCDDHARGRGQHQVLAGEHGPCLEPFHLPLRMRTLPTRELPRPHRPRGRQVPNALGRELVELDEPCRGVRRVGGCPRRLRGAVREQQREDGASGQQARTRHGRDSIARGDRA
jgi:hypothetical protein